HLSARFWKLVGRALCWKCPVCGEGNLFRGWLTMHDHCSHCGLKFEREPGFFLGSIYFNYGLTALLATIAYVVVYATGHSHSWQPKAAILAFVVLFPIVMHRFARALWIGFDQWYDPRGEEK